MNYDGRVWGLGHRRCRHRYRRAFASFAPWPVSSRCEVSTGCPFDRIVDSLALELEGSAIENIRPDVLWVGKHLMDGRPCQPATVLSENSGAIDLLGDFAFRLLVRDKPCVDLLDDLDLLLGAWDQDDPVRLQALSLFSAKQTLRRLIPIDQLAPEAIASGSALPESQLHEATLA